MAFWDRQISINTLCSWFIGVGLALFPIHNRWLAGLTKQGDEIGFFIPAFGAALWLIAPWLFIVYSWGDINWKNWGDRKIFVPLLVIVGAIGLSGVTAEGWTDKVAPLFAGASLFALYLVARKLGKATFFPLAIGAGIAALDVVLHGIDYPGQVTGGFLLGNYDMMVGYVLLGTALFIREHQWLLVSLALLAMFLSGSPEAALPCVAIVAVVLWRKDWGKKVAIAAAPTILIAVLWFGLGYGQSLYGYTWEILRGEETMLTPLTPADSVSPEVTELPVVVEPVGKVEPDAVVIPRAVDVVEDEAPVMVGTVHYRLQVIGQAMTNIKPFGEGYILTDFSRVKNVHNVPLVLVQQLGWAGILGAIAWLWVTVYCLIKTEWKYAWVLIIALSVFDHFIFTQLAPIWWCVIGVSTTSEIKSDMIFKMEDYTGI